MSMTETELDYDQAKAEVKERYRDETGEELPDHVVENLSLLSGASLSDVAEIQQRHKVAREHLETEDEAREMTTASAIVTMVWIAASGLVGVYAARFFAGWGAQVAGGAFVALLAAAALLAVLYGVDYVTG